MQRLGYSRYRLGVVYQIGLSGSRSFNLQKLQRKSTGNNTQSTSTKKGSRVAEAAQLHRRLLQGERTPDLGGGATVDGLWRFNLE